MPPGNTYPALLVQIAPGVASSAVPTEAQWVDVTGYCAGFDIRYGREDEFAQPSAGQADLRFDNSTGRFDPDNTAGPYYPNLKPLMWLRIKGGTTTPNNGLFYGQVSIEGWRLKASQFPDSTVSVTVLDMFEQLANTDLPASVYELEVRADNPRAWYRLGESSGTVATDSATATDIAVNGGFETGNLSGWTVASGVWAVSGPAYDGSYAAKTDAASADAYIYRDYTLTPGRWIISTHAKGTSIAGAGQGVALNVDQLSGSLVLSADHVFGLGTFDWTYGEVVAEVTATAVVRVYLQRGYAGTCSGVAEFDAVKVLYPAGGHHGTYEGGATFNSRTGLIAEDADNAIEFDTGPAYAKVPGTGGVQGAAWAIEAWFSIAPGTGFSVIWDQQVTPASTASQTTVYIDGTTGHPTIVTGTGGAAASADYRDDKAHHLVGTWDGTNLRIYIDGVLRNTSSPSSVPTAVPQAAAIGNYALQPNPGAGDLITVDEVATYNVALSSTRIAAHYAAGTAPWEGDTTGERINKLLDAVNFPASLLAELAEVTDAEALTAEVRRANAVHEAGHVVIGELWGVPCLGATIGAPGLAGRALVPPTGDVTIDVMVRFGGWYAERKACAGEDGQFHSFGMHNVTEDGCYSAEGSDFAAILDMLGDDEATFIRLGRQTGAAFEDSRVWAMVEALAEPLAERGWLSGGEVRAILDRAQGLVPPI